MAHLDKVQKQDNCKIVFSLFLAGNVSLDHSLFWKPCLCRFLNPNLLYSLQQMARRDNTSRSKLNLAKWRTSFFCPGSPHGVSKFWNGFRRVNSYLNHQPLPGALAYAQSAQSKHLSAAQLEWNLQADKTRGKSALQSCMHYHKPAELIVASFSLNHVHLQPLQPAERKIET